MDKKDIWLTIHTPFSSLSINRFVNRFFSSQELRVGAQFERHGLIFHNVDTERYNVLSFHWLADPMPYERLTYQDQMGGGNADTEFAFEPPSEIRQL